MDTLDVVLEDAFKCKAFAWDLECESTTDNPADAKNPHLARVTHVAIATPNTRGCWDATDEVISALCELLTCKDIFALVFNAPYDHIVMHLQGHLDHKHIRAKVLDVLLLTWMIDEEDRHGLKYSVEKFAKIKMTEFKDVVQNSRAAKALAKIEAQEATYDKIIKSWTSKTPKRPWPKWSDAPMSRTAVRKAFREKDPELTAKEAQAIVEELFSEQYLDEYRAWVETQKQKTVERKAKHKASINEHMKKYAADDATHLFTLYKKITPLLQEEGTTHVIEVEMAVRMETIDMELHGMPIDRSVLEKLSEELTELIQEFEARVYDLAKQEFNINSSDQMREVIFNDLAVQPPAYRIKTDRMGREQHIPNFTGAGMKLIEERLDQGETSLHEMDVRDMSTIPEDLRKYLVCNAQVLERIDHEIGQAILDYRAAAKLQSTYVHSTLERLDAAGEDILHGQFNCWGTVTGRFSSKNPEIVGVVKLCELLGHP